MALVGCKQGTPKEAEPMQVVIEGFTDTVDLGTIELDEVSGATAERVNKTTSQRDNETMSQQVNKTTSQQVNKATSQRVERAAKSGKAETIYVEAEGAGGRVWGHVTLKGDRGSGTIHDWDENTFSVTVTRHGNELFAVDQNSRQYVFKIRN